MLGGVNGDRAAGAAGVYTAGVRRWAGQATALADVPWSEVDGAELRVLLRELETVSRRVEAALAEATAALSGSLVRAGLSPGSAAQSCAEATGTGVGVARRRAEAGQRADTPAMRAVREGRIGAAHERVIAEHLTELPADTSEEVREELAVLLVARAAEGASPRAVGALARAELARLDPGRLDRVEELQQARRSLRLGAPGVDGLSSVGITCEPRLQALLDAVVARFGAPGQCVAAPVGPVTGDPADPATLAAADSRSPEQRAYDAVCHVMALGLQAAPGSARGVASIVVRVSPEQLDEIAGGGGLVATDAGAQLSTRQAVSLAGRRSWFVSALREGREELHRVDVDRAPRNRLASALQRMVLYAAHGGCTYPGCEQAAAKCQAHHVVEWAAGGETTVANLGDACPVHHGWVGAGGGGGPGGRPRRSVPGGWSTVADPARPGRPRWIPPGTPGLPHPSCTPGSPEPVAA